MDDLLPQRQAGGATKIVVFATYRERPSPVLVWMVVEPTKLVCDPPRRAQRRGSHFTGQAHDRGPP